MKNLSATIQPDSLCLVFLGRASAALLQHAQNRSVDLFRFLQGQSALATRAWADLQPGAVLRDCAIDSLGQIKCHFDVSASGASQAEAIENHVRNLIGFGGAPVISYTLEK